MMLRDVRPALVIFMFIFALMACQVEPAKDDEQPTSSGDGTMMEVTVGPEMVDCVGVGPRKCLEVDGKFFYEHIDGFVHEAGYTYRLRMERYDAFPGTTEPPADASLYSYRLVEVISKTADLRNRG